LTDVMCITILHCPAHARRALRASSARVRIAPFVQDSRPCGA
jgi:hypothetical protein